MNKREKIRMSKASYVEPELNPKRCEVCKYGWYSYGVTECTLERTDRFRAVSAYGTCDMWESNDE